jgi:hypothetical protein
MLPSAWGEGVGIAMMGDFGADLRGLLPRCVRFAPTSHPVNGNTRYWPVCSTLTRRDLHPLDRTKRFHLFIRFLLLQAFPNATPRAAHGTGLEPLDSSGSCHPLKAAYAARLQALNGDAPKPADICVAAQAETSQRAIYC